MSLAPHSLRALAESLTQLSDAIEHATLGDIAWEDLEPDHVQGAKNLARYVELRRHDIRDLQPALAQLGLSSFGRIESDVLGTIRSVQAALHAMIDGTDPVVAHDAGTAPTAGPVPGSREAGTADQGRDVLMRQSDRLLGPPSPGRRTRIMVTLPSKAAESPEIIDRVVDAGADLVRVNCAHDGPEAWSQMIGKVRHAERRVGRPLRVVMDLAGPKLRTGPIELGPAALKVKPRRDAYGSVVEPALVWLTPSAAPAPPGAVSVPVRDATWSQDLSVGDELAVHDARGRARTATVERVEPAGVLASMTQTAYLVPDLEIRSAGATATHIGPLPRRAQRLRIATGDKIELVRDLTPVSPTSTPARIGCTLSQVFDDIQVGHRVYFDDGKIGALVESVTPEVVALRITEAGPRGARLGAAKGINLPDTHLNLPALTDDDLAHLPFVAANADIVSLSFVREPADVRLLQRHLAGLDAADLGIILKIETVTGFENLPSIIGAALASRGVGVMIARGDLAVEAGYERLAEVQEEILWICEAARVPVVWATQVLDTLARTGRPSRAEVTDAAMAGRAECVMLNKGPYIVAAVEYLDDILRRMAAHQDKKRILLRQLHAWDEAFGTSSAVSVSPTPK